VVTARTLAPSLRAPCGVLVSLSTAQVLDRWAVRVARRQGRGTRGRGRAVVGTRAPAAPGRSVWPCPSETRTSAKTKLILTPFQYLRNQSVVIIVFVSFKNRSGLPLACNPPLAHMAPARRVAAATRQQQLKVRHIEHFTAIISFRLDPSLHHGANAGPV
jgi:hypothetical protein